MHFFSTNSFIIISSILGLGIIISPIVQNTWLIRILIASYISLSLVFLMPKSFAFNSYANIIYFFAIVIIFTIIEGSRFFDVAHWNVKRFSFEAISFSIFTVFFIVSIICLFVPLKSLGIFMTGELYNFFNEYIFFIAIIPLIFSILFFSRLRA